MGRAGAGDTGHRKVALVLEYEGTRYHGFQLQANGPSVQGEVEEAIARLTGERVRVHGAGRTDAGVHAAGQVVAFLTAAPYDVRTFRSALNYYLQEDIAVRAAYDVAPHFEPRRHAVSRVYRYTILNRCTRSPLWRRFTHQVPEALNIEAMEQALGYLVGEPRDFTPFCGSLGAGRSTVRRLHRAAIHRRSDLVALEVEGNAFLPQQVRRLAGAVLRVGTTQLSLEAFQKLADSGRRGAAEWVLPPQGLCLMRVKYRHFPPEDDERDEILQCKAE